MAASVPIHEAKAVAPKEIKRLFLMAESMFWSSKANLYHLKVNCPSGKVEYLEVKNDITRTVMIGEKRNK